MIDPSTYGMVTKRTPAQCILQPKITHTTTTTNWEVAIDTTGRGVLYFISCATVDINTIPRVKITIDGQVILATFDFTGTGFYLQAVVGTDAATPVNLDMPFGNSLKVEVQKGAATNASVYIWHSLGEL